MILCLLQCRLDTREEWFDLINEHEMAVRLFVNYYTDLEYYDMVNEFNLHTHRYHEVFHQLLYNAVFDVDSFNRDGDFGMDEIEKVEAKMFDLQKCVDLHLPGVNDFDVAVGFTTAD